MSKVEEKFKKFHIYTLNKKICTEHIERIVEIIQTIPGSGYTASDVFAESKGDRTMYGKWEHSLIAFYEDRPVGVLIAYERAAEKEWIYDRNCLYINEVAVSKHGYGLGEHMLKLCIKNAEYLYLKGEVVIRIQTEKSVKNEKVYELYKRIGFQDIGIKRYPWKEDAVLEIIKR